MDDRDSERHRKGATLSDKTARKECVPAIFGPRRARDGVTGSTAPVSGPTFPRDDRLVYARSRCRYTGFPAWIVLLRPTRNRSFNRVVQIQPIGSGSSGHYLERVVVTLTDQDRAEVSAVDREDPVYTSPLCNGSDHPIDESEPQRCESCVDFQRANQVERLHRLELVSRSRVENLGDELSHRPALPA